MPLLCPRCGEVQATAACNCTKCLLPLAWLRGFPDFQLALRTAAQGELASGTAVAPTIEAVCHTVALNRALPTHLGRARQNDLVLSDPDIEPFHAIIVPYPDNDAKNNEPCRFFLVDRGTRIGTFVNRQRILATELLHDDLLQIGPFAWRFSADDGQLVPLSQIDGIGLQLTGLEVRDRLGPQFELTIEPGLFVALVGGSGAGKSTLLKVLAGHPGLLAAGQVKILEPNGSCWPRAEYPDRFRDALGYVSQDSILHETLTARQTLTASARLRGAQWDAPTVEMALMRAELKREQWDQPISTLSGGENKRIRTASELMGCPRLLLLDEPDSGLDDKRRAALMKLLRALSWQGCTVVLVTHDEDDLDRCCDRVVRIQQGQIVPDGRGAKQQQDRRMMVPGPPPPAILHVRANWTEQFAVLIGRECALLLADWWSRLAVPGIVAILFALAVGVAVQPDHVPLLGFLSIVSVLWMSASGSLLSIAGERAVFDHERQLFLTVHCYLLAKFLVAVAVAFAQTLLFLGVLWLSRTVFDRSFFFFVLWAVLILSLTAVAGVALGLLLSALAGRKKETATFLLPLVMITQLVFSVPVADPDVAQYGVVSAYEKFSHTKRTVWLSAGLSYLTLSQPADKALRGTAYESPTEPMAGRNMYRTRGLATLVVWIVGLFTITFLWLLRWDDLRSKWKRAS